MNLKRLALVLIVFVFSLQLIAQRSATYTSEYVDYQKALSLYNSQQYLASQSLFEQIQNTTNDEVLQSDCAYFIANCAVRLNQINADALIESFVEDYPTSTKRNTAFIDVGDYYFENERFGYARKWYQKVDENALARSERERYNFNYGYASFSMKRQKDAKKYLNRVVDSPKYGSHILLSSRS